MFPIRDENPTLRWPLATVTIIGLNAAAWFWVQGLGSRVPLATSLCVYGLVPGELLGIAAPGTEIALGEGLRCVLDGSHTLATPLTSMFMHGGWFHILGNLWFLWVFGDNVEDAMGCSRFACFYVLCGLAAAAAQVASSPESTAPMVGASGAIGGVMGAYARLYPRARVHTLIPLGFIFTTVSLPAIFMLGYWFLLQILGGLPALTGASGGIAFWAHIGGFAAGVILVGVFQRADYLAAHHRQVRRSRARHRLW